MSTQEASHPDSHLRFAPLIGLRCHYFKWFEFHTLILFIDEATNPPEEGGPTKWRIYIECDWRLLQHGRKIVSDLDSDDLIFSRLAEIKGKDIKSVEFEGLNFKVYFTSDFSIEVATTSSPNEQWELRGSDGYRFGLRENFSLVEEQVNPD
jgi:hypothetical protein